MSVLQVQTNEEQQRFDKIWIPAFLEQGYEIESYILPGIRDVIFYDDDGDFGTLELVPWKAVPEWPINQTFPFHKFPQLHNKRVVEGDKLAIVKEKRGSVSHLLEILSYMFFQGGVDVHSDYGISLMNPDVYHILNERFNVPLIRLTMEGYENLPYYPVVVDVHKAKEMPLYKRMLRVKKMKQEALVNG